MLLRNLGREFSINSHMGDANRWHLHDFSHAKVDLTSTRRYPQLSARYDKIVTVDGLVTDRMAHMSGKAAYEIM